MQEAGFNAIGTEMSPWLCELADKTFGIPMECGAFESLKFKESSFDVVSIFDVLEHLLDPVAAVTKIARILKDDGVLALQTPLCWGLEQGYERLKNQNANFLVHLKENEHLFLFTKESVQKLLLQAGFKYFQFEKQIFEYDMWLFASKSPLNRIETASVERHLLSSPKGRIVLGLLDLYRSLETPQQFDRNDQYKHEKEDSGITRPSLTLRLKNFIHKHVNLRFRR
ncbi:class I SAM-dependent methyltransferase [Geotalea toluenoxydans]|uniref:class I SAM-dependent methyltransferase n=1 Tax=Geotalea toluenoxydans TaxID=421624 RepID=UPI0006D06B68|nr:class I SAM-dependent methyltransferase [Geotalea toluenoxydans]